MLIPKLNLEPFPEKLRLIKELPCATQGWHGHECCEAIDPAHYRHGLFLGANIKDDLYVLPMCRIHHSLQGHYGEKRFWGGRLMDAKVLCLQLHIAYLNENKDGMYELVRNFG